jgi:hypothetical protein
MNLVQALDLTNDVARARKLMGMNAVYPYKPDQFVDALLALRDELQRQLVQIKQYEKTARSSKTIVHG